MNIIIRAEMLLQFIKYVSATLSYTTQTENSSVSTNIHDSAAATNSNASDEHGMDTTKHETNDTPKKRFLKRYWSVNTHENVDGNSARVCNDSGVDRYEPDYRETLGRTRLSEGEMQGDGSARELQKVVRSNLQDSRQLDVEPCKIRRLSTNVDDNGECAALSSGVSRIRVSSVGDNERFNDQIGEEMRVRRSGTKHGIERSNDQIGEEMRVRRSDTRECLRTDNKKTQHLNHKPTSTDQDMPTVPLNNPPLPTNETHSSERIDSTRTNIENASNWDTMKLYLRILIKFWNINDHYIIRQTGILAKALAPNYEAVPPEQVDGNVADKHNMHTKTLLNHVRAHNTTISGDQSTSTPTKTYSPAEIRKLHRQIQQNKRELYDYAQQNDQSLEESLYILFTNMEHFFVFHLAKNCCTKSMHDMTELVEQKDKFFDVLALRNFKYDTCVHKHFKQMCADQARIFANHEFEKKLAIFPEFWWLGGCIDALNEQMLNDRVADLVLAFYVMGKYEQFMDGIMMEYAFMKDENEGNNTLEDEGDNMLEDEASTTSKDDGNNTMRNIKYNTTSNTLRDEEGNTSNNTTKNAKSNATNNPIENLNTKTLEKDQHVKYTADDRKSNVGNNKKEIPGEKSFDKKNATHTSTQTRTIRVLTKNQNLTKVFVREVLIGYLINSFLCDRYLTVAYENITRLSFDYFCRKKGFKIVLNRTSDSFYDFLFRHLIIVQRTLHERSIFNTLLAMRNSSGLPTKFKEIHGVILSNNLAEFNIPTYKRNVQMTKQPSDMNTLYEEHMNEMYMSRVFVYTGSSGYNLLAYSSY